MVIILGVPIFRIFTVFTIRDKIMKPQLQAMLQYDACVVID